MEELIRQLKQLRASYRPNPTVQEKLKDKELVMVIGPSAVGKDFTIDQICKDEDDHSKVTTHITRRARPDDDLQHTQLHELNEETLRDLIAEAEAGELVNLAVHPTNSQVSFTLLSSYPASTNYLPMLYNAASALDDAGFMAVRIMGVLSQPDEWMNRFDDRHTDPQERSRRFEEARLCLQWLEHNTDRATFVYNEQSKPHVLIDDQERVQEIINSMRAAIDRRQSL